jgi:opacity protein-like surface antigen
MALAMHPIGSIFATSGGSGMLRVLHLVVPLVLAVYLLADVGVGQSSDRVEVFGGFSYVSNDFSNTASDLKGWGASANFKIARYIGMDADFSGYYPSTCCGNGAKVHTFLFGPQVSFGLKRLTVFGHFLLGDANVLYSPSGSLFYHYNVASENSFSYAEGGGVDFRLMRRLALRGEVDALHTNFQTVDSQGASDHRAARILAGVVFRF